MNELSSGPQLPKDHVGWSFWEAAHSILSSLLPSAHFTFQLALAVQADEIFNQQDYDLELIILLLLCDCDREGCRHVLPGLGLYSVGG